MTKKSRVLSGIAFTSRHSILGSVGTICFCFYCKFVTCSFLESMDVHAIAVSSSWLDDAARFYCNTAVRSRHPGILQACSKVKSIFKTSKYARPPIKKINSESECQIISIYFLKHRALKTTPMTQWKPERTPWKPERLS